MFGFFENIFCRENGFEIFNSVDSVKSCWRDSNYSTAFKKVFKVFQQRNNKSCLN